MTEECGGGLAFRNPIKQVGYATIYHVVTLDQELSDGAFRLYLLLLKYTQDKVECWPGRERLARDLGVSKKTIERRLEELVERGFITRQQRGHGLTAMTYLEDLENVYISPLKNEEACLLKNDGALASSKMTGKQEQEEEQQNSDDDDDNNKQKQNTLQAHLALAGIGVTSAAAHELATTHDLERVLAVIEHASKAAEKNPAGLAVWMLRNNAEIPPMTEDKTEQRDSPEARRRYLEWAGGGR